MTTVLNSQIQQLIDVWKKTLGASCFPGVSDRACPVPFFGRIEQGTEKSLIFTLGENPSNREFLKSNGNFLRNTRFPKVTETFNYTSKELLDACMKYFDENPYARWFGKDGGSKIEGLLNTSTIDASYYGKKKHLAVHIDLMPFPTLCKFTTIQENQFFNLLIAAYGIPLIARLIKEYEPKLVICISQYVCEALLDCEQRENGVKYYYGNYGEVPFIGSSVYYPNSRISYNPSDVAIKMKSLVNNANANRKRTLHNCIDFGRLLEQHLK